MYKCPNCAGEMEFLPDRGIIKCQYCGSEFSPEEASRLEKTRKSAEEQKMPEGKVYTCSQCGASLYTTEETGVTFCSYCGSQAFLESRIRGDEDILPDLIIPFRISKEQCESIYKQKVKSAWFLPREMKSDTTIDKFRGIYMPCWVYTGEVDAQGDYTGTTTHRQGSYDIIETYDVKADAKGTYSGYVKDASASFPDSIMKEISPFRMNASKPFNDRYMTGFYADIGNVPEEVYHEEICRTLDANAKTALAVDRNIRNKNISRTAIDRETTVQARITSTRKGFLPVWFLSNKNERTGMMSYAVVNGLTGKIHADLPVDMKKYLLLSLLIAIPVFLILQFFTMKPMVLLVTTMLLLAVLMFFSTRMIRETYIQEHGLDDMGLQYLQHKGEGIGTGTLAGGQSRTRKRMSGKLKRTLFGILCFVGLPILSGIISQIVGVNMIAWGFIVGIVLFFLLVSTGKSTGKDTAEFEPGSGRIKVPFYMFLRSILLPVIGILVGIVISVAAPAHDIYYYGASVLCSVLLILTVLDFVRRYNRLAFRKPVQLEKRGGDEDE